MSMPKWQSVQSFIQNQQITIAGNDERNIKTKKNQILFKNRAIKEQPGWLQSIYPAIAGSALVTRARAPSEQSPPD